MKSHEACNFTQDSGIMCALLFLRSEDPSSPQNALSCLRPRSGDDRCGLGEFDLSRSNKSLNSITCMTLKLHF